MTQQLRPKSLSPRKLTYEEFLEWDGENQHVEWVDGEVIPIAPIGDAHLIRSLEALQCVWPE